MKARDVMVRDVITIGPRDSVAYAAKLIAQNDVSALPVIDDNGRLVGLISEGDLMNREEIGTEIHHPWWIEAVTPGAALAAEFAKSHGKRVEEVMSENVITATEDTSLADIAALLERNRIKRVPILRDGELVGIVSRRRWPRTALRAQRVSTPTASFARNSYRASSSRDGPISAAATSLSAMARSTCGASSARRPSPRR